MKKLNSDLLFSLAIHLDLPNLLNFCSTNTRINDLVCNREHIWRYKLNQDFPNDFMEFKDLHKAPKDLYILLWKLKDLKQQLKLGKILFYIYNLQELDLSRRKGLVKLPSSLNALEKLKKLKLNSNKLTKLPKLPPSLQYLNVSNNELTELPELPSSLQRLYVEYNQLTELPELPSSLKILSVYNNKLTKLPKLPPSLQHLYISDNQLTQEKLKKEYPDIIIV